MNWKAVVTCFAVSLATTACSSPSRSGGSRSVQEGDLSQVTPEQMTRIVEARSERDLAEYDVARTSTEVSRYEKELEVARSSVAVAAGQVETAQLRAAIAEEHADDAELAGATATVEEVSRDLAREQALVRVRELELARARAACDLSIASLALSRVAVSLAEVDGLRRPTETQADRLKALRSEMRQREAEVGHARVDLKAIDGELAERRAEYQSVLEATAGATSEG
jgi:hypothetical protein